MTRRVLHPGALASGDTYKLLIGLVVPRPIGWIGSVDASGHRNLAPFSFFNVVAAHPPTVMFSPLYSRGSRKDTLANVEETGEFTVNVVSVELVERMNVTSGRYPSDVDEFELAGVTSQAATRVRAPLVSEAPAGLECVVSRLVPVGDPPSGSTVVMGEVVAFHIREEILDGTRIDQVGLDAVGRMGGPSYTRTRDQFEMQRPV